ncbi:MAG TPA: AprI/Inh family metalloprotease inhibitor, partial [Alphaproteobacteria bacterium]|nr:AprI/Inh family metalloprotease inhibitor [Alphaproteobacteria bacterium]
GQPVLGGGQPQTGTAIQTASTDDSFVTLDAVGSVPNAPGRDLSGGLTIEKLLGGWTVVSGAEQCKLNLTYTSKAGTSRYRASAPGCQLAGLKVVASWQLAGSQVQLFDENGDMIAALILSGNRFIGTLAGGQGISMVG